MRTFTVYGLAMTFLCLASLEQQGTTQVRHDQKPGFNRLAQTNPGLSKTSLTSVRSFYKSKSDWGRIIDSTWGPGLPTAEKLQIFDTFFDQFEKRSALFPNLTTNWDSLRTVLRPQVAAGMSRGKFAGILGQVCLAMLDGQHSWIRDRGVDSAFENGIVRGVPMLTLGTPYSQSGIGVVPMPDSSLFVYKTLPDHPLGLKPGDIILGYDGVPWKKEIEELIAAQLPVWAITVHGGTEESYRYSKLISVVNNWGLFDTIDVVKYSTGDTLHLSTFLLDTLYADPWIFMCADQMPLPGIRTIEEAINSGGSWISSGVIGGTNIGYIAVFGWSALDASAFAAPVDEFMHRTKVSGLILDFRSAGDGSPEIANEGLAQLFNFDPTDNYGIATRSDSSNRLGFTFAKAYTMEHLVPKGEIYDRPIAVLTGPLCLCAGEKNAFRMRFHPMVRFFGKRTFGAPVGQDWVSGNFANGAVPYGFRTSMYYSNYNNEGHMVHKPFPVDEDVWLTRDGVAKGEDAVVKRAMEWILSLSHAHDMQINKILLKKIGDSVGVTARVENPASHTVTVSAILANANGVQADSVVLLNDGLHGDGAAGDSIWGAFVKSPAGEGFFAISLRTDDRTQSTFRRLPNVKLVTSTGPVTVDGYQFGTSDTTAAPGKTLTYKVMLKNTGSTATIPNVTAKVRTLDTTIVLANTLLSYGDLAPGISSTGTTTQRLKYSASRPGSYVVQFSVDISSNGVVFWQGTFSDFVTGVAEAEGNLPKVFALDQNYPNPFNPSTTIRYALPVASQVSLMILDVLGRIVSAPVNGKEEAGIHEFKFDASGLSSGVYFYRLRAGDFVQTRKLLLVH